MTTDGPKDNPESQPTVDLPQPATQNGKNPSRFALDDLVAGRYRIVRFLGEGAMGEVYEAQDLELHESVALKTVRPEIATDPRAIDRFKREVHLARQVTHPNVARIFDIGHHGDVTFLSMELLSGETLAAHLHREGRMTPRQAFPLVAQMAAGLAAAHKAEIVHRDFKSANVMLAPSNEGMRVVVADFGIARGNVSGDPTLTATGAMLGTPSYMAPEQVLGGGTITAAADQYALGVVIFEMVAGAKPFLGDTPVATAVKRLSEAPPSPRVHVPDLDATWEAAILRCLERDPADRFASVLDVVKALGGEHVADGTKSLKARARWRVGARLAGTTALVVAGSVLAYRFLATPYLAINSIAVLPFVNVGANPDLEYLSEGLTDSLIDALSRLPHLTVMSRNAAFRYKGRESDAQKAGRELKVDAVLTGRVSPHAEDLAISTELVDVSKGSRLWGEQYDRKVKDIVTMQAEIVRRIAEQLRPALSGEAAKRLVKPGTENPEAYQLYLKGRYFSSRYTQEGFKKGIDYLNRAVEEDPSYALAYAGLAASYYDASGLYLPPKEVMPRAKAAALQALKLDDNLAEAHHALALVLANYDWNWPEADKEYRRAIELSPNYAPSHLYYGASLMARGRLDEAVVEMTRARDLDPMTSLNSSYLAYLSYLGRHYDEAAAQFESVIEVEPNFSMAHYTLGSVFQMKAMFPEAIAEIEKAKSLDPKSSYILALLGNVYALGGEKRKAREILENLKARSKREYIDASHLAIVYAGLGDNDQAFAWLDKAVEDRSEVILILKLNPMFDGLRGDPRFAALLARAGV